MTEQPAAPGGPSVVADPGARGFRPDVQGLRAMAVLLVVCSHVVGWPHAGFIGVDVFFVISGFLITGTLLRAGERPWREVVGRFYVHRVRRILPAALTTLAVTVVVARLVFSGARADRVATDALWSSVFAANWHFASVGTDYFGSSAPASPLQHYWSLAVEEQFYLVWPLLLGLALIGSAHRRGAIRARVLVLAAAVVVASFAWACVQTSTEPLGAYFETGTRVWEIGVGALLACLSSYCARIPDRVREVMVATGLVGILGAAVLFGSRTPFPGPGAALPVLAAAVFLAAGTGAGRRLRTDRLLSSAPVRHLGDISYSVYLWHWPVLVFVGATVGRHGWRPGLLTLLVTLVLSEVSHRVVERPFLRPRASRSRGRSHWRWAAVAAAGAVVLLAAVPGQSVGRTPASSEVIAAPGGAAAVPAPRASSSSTAPDQVAALTASLHDQVVAALAAHDFPALVPSIDRPDAGVAPEMAASAGCLNPAHATDTAACTFTLKVPRRGSVVILGDSVALAWLPGIRAALAPEGYSVHAVTFSNCPPALVDVSLESESWTSACRAGLADALDQVDRLKPDLVVGSAYQNALREVVSTSARPNVQTSYIQGLADVGRRVRAAGARFVLLGPPPAGPSPLDCGGRFQHPADCVTSPRGDFEATLSAFANAAQQGGFGFVDTEPWFCVGTRCPIFVGGHLIRWDDGHLTDQFARYLAPLLRATLLPEVDGRGPQLPAPGPNG